MSIASRDGMDCDFHYTDIDKETLKLLEQQNLREPLGGKVTLTKWCIDERHRIALLYTGWVSCTIARTADNHSQWTYLLVVDGNQSRIELSREGLFIGAERNPIRPEEIVISPAFAEKTGLTSDQLKTVVGIAIGAIETGQRGVYREQ